MRLISEEGSQDRAGTGFVEQQANKELLCLCLSISISCTENLEIILFLPGFVSFLIVISHHHGDVLLCSQR